MYLNIVKADGNSEYELIRQTALRAGETAAVIDERAQAIMRDVSSRGWDAVAEYSLKFDGTLPYEVDLSRLDEAYAACSPELIAALEKAAENIRVYHQNMMVKSWELRRGNAIVGQQVRGLTRVGLYVPGGTAAYPSSVLMTAIPAKVAGVQELIMVSPPRENLSNEVLAAAKIAGVDRVLAVGGAQAIAALTYGAGFIPAVDKIVGPGNAYVAAAKRFAFGKVDIDMIAGPSEVLVIADETAQPEYVAADLLSQAEHDPLASAVLLTTSYELACKVSQLMQQMASRLSRTEIIDRSVAEHSYAVVTGSLQQACELANIIAPEHLEIMTAQPRQLLDNIKNAGAVFLGAYSPEPLGDYMAGPCHVLPTSGTARFFSPLSTDSFLKKMSVIEYDRASLKELSGGIVTLALSEGLDAHANSITVRVENEL